MKQFASVGKRNGNLKPINCRFGIITLDNQKKSFKIRFNVIIIILIEKEFCFATIKWEKILDYIKKYI